ncbi:LuxR C-terminal-related transcriptional regulator [Ectopseudomonas alcaliphila]|uniref:LuxR C-terminal-related transcriptional regulator n=1 Tax=Ectopseudomonas alcaliphila TaxID=101564 RepID=UPI002780CE6A|nr:MULTISPECIES: LuxR C-terminal-related transcriptional regulator [Pseudomonas]MDP9937918.1 ATP/maltotriose-dependent transcriptional regulator MalT [Pseudomonas sp. 3400]MDR7010141.1 ATP/maltotriose-dependent transcriptional regulator MalT [Pseudomonas alcaliphila]
MPTLAIARPSALQAQPADLPRLPPCVVSRPALLQRLLASESRLRLLCAPAGTGKSVLLGQCARHTPAAVERAWLDLGGRSLTPVQLCRRLAAALQLPNDDANEAGLIERLHERAGRLWIFIDDYPRQADDELDACLDRLFAAAPAQVTWWVSSRRTPAWNLPRLLLQGDLQELKGEELALDEEGLVELLTALQVNLADDVRQALLHSSEGWLAAIRLLLLDADEEALRQRLQAGCPLLRDYVQREVLADLDDELRSDLHALALLPRFALSLCEHLLEGRGAELLSELQRRQLFVHSLDSSGTWFRLWRPLANVLRSLPSGPMPAPIHVRACQWFARHGDIREAVEHALQAGQVEVAVNYLQRFSQEQLLQGHSVAQFLQWREELPAWLFASSPRLIVLQAWALIICARFDEAQACTEALTHFLPQPDARRQRKLLGHWQALSGVLARQCGRRDARQHCLEALQALDDSGWSQRILCYQALAQQYLAENALDQAQQALDEGLRLSRLHGSLIYEALLNTDRCLLLEMQGEAGRAAELAEQSLALLRGRVSHSPVVGRLLLLRASLLARQGLDELAQLAYRQGLQEAELCEDAYTISGYLGLVELAEARGDLDEAYQWMQKAERAMQCSHVPEVRYRGVLQLQAGRLLLRQEQYGRAREVFAQTLQQLQQRQQLAPSGFYDLLPHLRRYLAVSDLLLGHHGAAEHALRLLLDECQMAGHRSLTCECHVALAESLLLQGRAEQAEVLLQQALGEARQLRLLRPLLELQQRQPQWLERLLPGEAGQNLYQRLFEPAPRLDEPASAGTALLSSRELAVLQLIAQGCSNQEIADRLFISLHTVKTHARRINVKLGVQRRTQAVAMAKAYGLMGD